MRDLLQFSINVLKIPQFTSMRYATRVRSSRVVV